MLRRSHATNLTDIFAPGPRGGCFLRINSLNSEVEAFLPRLYEAARRGGAIIEGRIPNPTDSNLAYYYEMMGQDFRLEAGFIEASLGKWLPRMNPAQRHSIAASIHATLERMAAGGKTVGMLKNAYVKFMCWFYFKFEQVAAQLGSGSIPKVLYQGSASLMELQFLSILCGAGCDVVLVQCAGDGDYLKLDPRSELSDAVALSGATPFPAGFSVGELYRRQQSASRQPQSPPLPAQRPDVPLNIPRADYALCTNAWITGGPFESVATPSAGRGTDENLIYNCFIRVEGVQDRLTYPNELIQLHHRLTEAGRRVLILEDGIPQPSPEEIEKIRHGNYPSVNAAIAALAANLNIGTAVALHGLLARAFMEVLAEEAKKPNANVNRITSSGIYLLCWLKRYYAQLLADWKPKALGCLIWMGGCRSEREALFLKMLSRLPVDVLMLKPNLDDSCCLQDARLYELHFPESLTLRRFPREGTEIRVRTAASHAERDLDETLYQGSGLYRNRQFNAAQSITLVSTYEEIAIYWKQDLKYRPSFDITGDTVMMPVLFAQANGVKNRDVNTYWAEVKKLVTPDTCVVRGFPWMKPADGNPFTSAAVDFFRNGRLQRERIRSHRNYPFALLRSEIQEHILDKLQVLIDQRTIRGTFENGTEYQIIATVLNIPAELVRLIQQFDFTKKNPKVLCVNTGETAASKQDAILLAFLNLVGFDIVCYVPTGYQCLGQWYARSPIVEHQIGDYVYDLSLPELTQPAQGTLSVWRKIFKRGS